MVYFIRNYGCSIEVMRVTQELFLVPGSKGLLVRDVDWVCGKKCEEVDERDATFWTVFKSVACSSVDTAGRRVHWLLLCQGYLLGLIVGLRYEALVFGDLFHESLGRFWMGWSHSVCMHYSIQNDGFFLRENERWNMLRCIDIQKRIPFLYINDFLGIFSK